MIKKRILVCLMLFLATLFLFGCENTQPHKDDAEGIEPSVALKLRKDYLKQLRSEDPKMKISLEELWVQDYYGIYSGCEIVFMGGIPAPASFYNVVVAGYVITLPAIQELYVHKDSHFYTLNEAYDEGYITKEDIEDFGPKAGVDFKEKGKEEYGLIVTIPPA